MTSNSPLQPNYGLLLLNKPAQKTSFFLVSFLRKLTKIRKIGHAGTLDPFATGLMVMLIGKPYTKLSDRFLKAEKAYVGTVTLGSATDSYDIDGQVTTTSDKIPSLEEVQSALAHFQGEVEQIPPMFSAKKIKGQKLYDLARKGIEVERAPKKVQMKTTLVSYNYPELVIEVSCSSGTYIRSIAHDLGIMLGTYGHLKSLIRTKLGPFTLDQAQSIEDLKTPSALNLRNAF